MTKTRSSTTTVLSLAFSHHEGGLLMNFWRSVKRCSFVFVLSGLVIAGMTGCFRLCAPRPPAKSRKGCVQTGESIQKAIDRTPPGGTVCISQGIWEEHIVISKSLTLVGEGVGLTILKAKEPDRPIILVNSEKPITVVIKDLTVTGVWSSTPPPWEPPEPEEIKNLGPVGSTTLPLGDFRGLFFQGTAFSPLPKTWR